ncbi:hypothetical protein KQI69_01770 [Eubacterium sp. MSJ-13]|uniref:TadE/TadG family type IV pilus assembly protein n=1 Tax=Eubacterium sp. MSJ-13 TaxID=2841513 RepID=UPI001C105775|nr:hypothetical protein [Eubacterium sp. MSJ-13]MBU5477926.1 hypothetical protein [Eubacterium sp. MSJ-13]
MNKRYRISANYTVEAAFIVPMILGIIFAMIYMLFFLHDRVILQENLRCSLICEEKINKKDVSQNLRILKITDIKCDVGKIYIKAEVSAVSKFEIPVVHYFMKRTKKICIKTKYLKVKPDIMIRYRQRNED